MKIFKWLLGIILVFVPIIITVYVIISTFWKIFLAGAVFFIMIRCGIFLLREESI